MDILAPERNFTYRPLAVGEPFDRARAVQADLRAIAAERGFGLIRDVVGRVDAEPSRCSPRVDRPSSTTR